MRPYLLAGLPLIAVAAPAAAQTSFTISPSTLTYASFDASGASIPNNVAAATGGVTNDGVPFWTATTTFTLPTGSIGSTLSLTGFASDDRAVAFLNGIPFAAVGIFGDTLLGQFIFTPGGTAVPLTFVNNGTNFTTPLTLFGTNTLTFIVNNTNDGIRGSTLTGGPSSLFGTVTINAAAAVPEPASWGLMIAGFGLAGAALRRRAKVRTAVTFA